VHHELAALCPVDVAPLEEPRCRADDDLARRRVRKKVSHPSRNLRVFFAREPTKVGERSLVEHHEAVPVPRERGIEKLA